MRRSILLFTLAIAFLLTAPAIRAGAPAAHPVLLPGLDTALACCSGQDRQRCSQLCDGGRAYCDQGACLCACPVF